MGLRLIERGATAGGVPQEHEAAPTLKRLQSSENAWPMRYTCSSTRMISAYGKARMPNTPLLRIRFTFLPVVPSGLMDFLHRLAKADEAGRWLARGGDTNNGTRQSLPAYGWLPQHTPAPGEQAHSSRDDTGEVCPLIMAMASWTVAFSSLRRKRSRRPVPRWRSTARSAPSGPPRGSLDRDMERAGGRRKPRRAVWCDAGAAQFFFHRYEGLCLGDVHSQTSPPLPPS